jgi:hypothetical protein
MRPRRWQIAPVAQENRMLDRRKNPRLRSFKGARIDFHPDWPPIDCTVRNVSRAGACLEIGGDYNTALAFALVFTQDNEKRACRQIWRRGTRIGVAFASPARPRESGDPGRMQTPKYPGFPLTRE